VTAEVRTVRSVPFRVAFRRDRLATRSDVLGALKVGSARVVDARSAAEYAGSEVRSRRGGHIPGACPLEWTDLVDKDGRFLDEATLRARLDQSGVKPGTPVITHCQGGGRASVDAFVTERLGFPTRNYYPGWSDWGNADETPVEAGAAKGRTR
jgi:thiosulfate/3-mercaptopyruvate sulfurtransferase